MVPLVRGLQSTERVEKMIKEKQEEIRWGLDAMLLSFFFQSLGGKLNSKNLGSKSNKFNY